MIHPEQQNVDQFCQHAEFVDSGFQSFRDQVTHLPPQKLAEASYFAGAALALKLSMYFTQHGYTAEQIARLMDHLYAEVDEYMERNRMRIEWEPHVPTGWKQ